MRLLLFFGWGFARDFVFESVEASFGNTLQDLKQAHSISNHARLSSQSTASVASRGAHSGVNFLGGGWYLAFLLLTGTLARAAAPTNDNFADSILFTNSSTNSLSITRWLQLRQESRYILRPQPEIRYGGRGSLQVMVG
jgi:hypothetical protein